MARERSCCQDEIIHELRCCSLSLCFQTMAIVNELGMEQLCAVMGSGASTVSLAACHLLQVMFEALTEGMKKEVRGKNEAILPGAASRTHTHTVPSTFDCCLTG